MSPIKYNFILQWSVSAKSFMTLLHEKLHSCFPKHFCHTPNSLMFSFLKEATAIYMVIRALATAQLGQAGILRVI